MTGKSVRRPQAGYSLIEMLISTAIILTVTGALFAVLNPTRGIARMQPEAADMQQRVRAAVAAVVDSLRMAGAGPIGGFRGSLTGTIAPILPYRTGRLQADPPGSFRPDAVTVVYVANATPASLRQPASKGSTVINVNPQPGCPPGNDLCGFEQGAHGLFVTVDGQFFESVEVAAVQPGLLELTHGLKGSYADGSTIVPLEAHTFYFDAGQLQLRHYDGNVTDVPVVDHVVAVRFAYYGDPNPPMPRGPSAGVESCMVDAAGNPRLAHLPGDSFVLLDRGILGDGLPGWCETAGGRFDPDVLRIRRVSVTIRVEASEPWMRGWDGRFFPRPSPLGNRAPGLLLPDYELSTDVTPRNLNLAR
jgi:prepilin-type N-terminal cleavage/methylation domain-containing protein